MTGAVVDQVIGAQIRPEVDEMVAER